MSNFFTEKAYIRQQRAMGIIAEKRLGKRERKKRDSSFMQVQIRREKIRGEIISETRERRIFVRETSFLILRNTFKREPEIIIKI